MDIVKRVDKIMQFHAGCGGPPLNYTQKEFGCIDDAARRYLAAELNLIRTKVLGVVSRSWGKKALKGYLGNNCSAWYQYNACELIDDGVRVEELLINQRTDDEVLQSHLNPELLEHVCVNAGIVLTLNLREGYDHSFNLYGDASLLARGTAS